MDPWSGKEVTRAPGDEESFSALAYKVMTDPFVGRLVFFRVYSGTLKSGAAVLNPRMGKQDRVGRVVRMHANKREEVENVFAGQIAASVGLKRIGNGHSKGGKDVRFRLPGGAKVEIPGTIFLRLVGLGLILLVLLKLYGVDVRGLIPGEQGNENAAVTVEAQH